MKSIKEFILESSYLKGDLWGIKGCRLVDNGEHGDPEIAYDGEIYNYNNVEEYIADDNDIMDLYGKDANAFDEWMEKHQKEVQRSFMNYVSDMAAG